MFAEWLMDFATIAAGQLGRPDWQNYRRMLLLHVADCDLYCWYCYNDAWDGVKDITVNEMDTKEILRQFFEYRSLERAEGNQVNILRISGGEPFTEPELVEDLANDFASFQDSESAFLWVDTNLHPFGDKLTRAQKAALEALARLGSRVAVHACIHGATAETLMRNSMKVTKPENITAALKAFDQRKIPIYPRINPAALLPAEVGEIFLLLLGASTSNPFPLRSYLGPIELSYEHAIDRMRLFQGQPPVFVESAKPCPIQGKSARPDLHAPNIAIFEWNRLLEENYGVGYGRIPRHKTAGIKPLAPRVFSKKMGLDRKWEELILLCKGWEKEVYAQKMLEILSVPSGAWVYVEFENKWIEPGLLAYAFACPTFHESRNVKALVTCSYKTSPRGMIPLRWAILKGLSATDYQSKRHSLTLTLEMEGYASDVNKRTPGEEKEGFSAKIARYVGLKHLPFESDTSYFCRLVGFELLTGKMTPSRTNSDQDFKSIVIELAGLGYEAAKRDVYFRIKAIKDAGSSGNLQFTDGVLSVTEGSQIEIVFEACNPNLGNPGYPEVEQAQIRLATTEVEHVRISPERLHLSKYGELTARLFFARTGEYRGEILIESVREGARIPSFRIPFQVEVER
jgi:organic radical activating enzyme